MKEWNDLVWPIRSRFKVVSFLLISLGSDFLSLRWVVFESLLWMFPCHYCCYLLVSIWLIFGFRSVYGILEFLPVTMSSEDLANESALWLPRIPIWLGIQKKITFLIWFMEFRKVDTLEIIKLWNIRFFFLRESTGMDNESFWVACRDNVECLSNCAGFSGEDGILLEGI